MKFSSEILTVWRTLWVELDSMKAPADTDGPFGNAQPEPDDPAFDPGNAVVDLLAPNFERAYVAVEVVAAPDPDTSDEKYFLHNMEVGVYNDVASQLLMQDVAILNDDDFWAVQLIGSYEGNEQRDFDTDGDAVGGWCYSGQNFAFIFNETLRDVAANGGALQPPVVDEGRLKQRVPLHEVGHMFGMHHITVERTIMTKNGPLGPNVVWFGTDEEAKFSESQLGQIQDQPKPVCITAGADEPFI